MGIVFVSNGVRNSDGDEGSVPRPRARPGAASFRVLMESRPVQIVGPRAFLRLVKG
jgi:hypothetical protein